MCDEWKIIFKAVEEEFFRRLRRVIGTITKEEVEEMWLGATKSVYLKLLEMVEGKYKN